jgi:GDPmannose 4,6-dehydratase
MFTANGILFNHESPRRGSNFVTNKVAKTAVQIKMGITDALYLGNLEASRDWGHAKDYVKAMWMMLQDETPGDYVCATGISHNIGDLCEYAFSKLDLDYTQYVRQDEKFLRAEELKFLKGDSTKIRTRLKWAPEYTFETMLDDMIQHWKKIYDTK